MTKKRREPQKLPNAGITQHSFADPEDLLLNISAPLPGRPTMVFFTHMF